MVDLGVDVARGVEENGGAAGRTIRRRRTLPAGRAVVGGFLVVLAATIAFAAYTRATATPLERYVVARHELVAGTHLTRADLTLATMHLPRSIGFRSATPLIGTTVVAPIGKGELIQPSAVLDKRSRPTDRELSIPIDSARAVSGELRPGDRVDVAATFGSGGDAYTVWVLRGAEVLSRQQTNGGLSAHSNEVLVLSMPSATDALAVSHAISVGQLSIVRATGTPPAGTDPYRAPAAPTIEDTHG